MSNRARPASPFLRWLLSLSVCLSVLAGRPAPATADDDGPPPRPVRLEWDHQKRRLYASVGYRDIVDAALRHKLTRGLPTTIVMTATVFRGDLAKPVATTLQSCKVTWHVWEEAYRIELIQPGVRRTRWTTTLEGVIRRCAEANNVLVATHRQLPFAVSVYLVGKIQVNPLSPRLLEKIKRWVSRPSATGTAGPGDALFGTFTGLFLQRIGEAERQMLFTTYRVRPKVREPPPPREKETS